MTGTATFTKLTNNIELTDIRDELALEVGDVIQISGSADNDSLYTVESIADAANLIVNYEHRNGAGSLSLTDEAVAVTIKRIAKWFNAPLGLGQAWVDTRSLRTANTAYTNTTNRSMQVNFNIQSGQRMDISSDGINWMIFTLMATGAGLNSMANGCIPAGWQWKSSGIHVSVWQELR